MNTKKINIVTLTKEDTSTDNSIEILRQQAFESDTTAESYFCELCAGVRAEINDSGDEDYVEYIDPTLGNRDNEDFEEMSFLRAESCSACTRYKITRNRIRLITEGPAEEDKLPDTLYAKIFVMGIAGGVELVREDNIYKDANNDFAFDMTTQQNAYQEKHAWKTQFGIGVRLLATDGEYYNLYSDHRDTFTAPDNE